MIEHYEQALNEANTQAAIKALAPTGLLMDATIIANPVGACIAIAEEIIKSRGNDDEAINSKRR